jgi:hypothetical protein
LYKASNQTRLWQINTTLFPWNHARGGEGKGNQLKDFNTLKYKKQTSLKLLIVKCWTSHEESCRRKWQGTTDKMREFSVCKHDVCIFRKKIFYIKTNSVEMINMKVFKFSQIILDSIYLTLVNINIIGFKYRLFCKKYIFDILDYFDKVNKFTGYSWKV